MAGQDRDLKPMCCLLESFGQADEVVSERQALAESIHTKPHAHFFRPYGLGLS
jgi:hypothetical protein